MDQLPRLGKRELICLLLFTCNYVVSVWRGFLFLWVLGMGYVILLWHSLSLSYNYFLRRTLFSCPPPPPIEVKEEAYKGMVRPILEYGSSVWDPYTDKLKEELEKGSKSCDKVCDQKLRI